MVALLAEGVDRNSASGLTDSTRTASVALLAEGVDRNIGSNDDPAEVTTVALLAEGVDRNFALYALGRPQVRRPPRGGRG